MSASKDLSEFMDFPGSEIEPGTFPVGAGETHPKYDLLDPVCIHTAEKFIAECDAARLRLRDSDDVLELKTVGTYAAMLQALAGAIGLGREFEVLGKGLRFEAFYRVAQIRGKRPVGRPRGDDKTHEVDIFDKSEQRLMRVLAQLEEEEFGRRLAEGIKEKNLTEKSFRNYKLKTRGVPHNKDTSSEDSIGKRSLGAFYEFWDAVIENPEYFAKGFYEDDYHQWVRRATTSASILRIAAKRILELLGPE
jgi:hypothetical protein